MSRVYVTGVAGMIGANVARMLLAEGCEVIGIDNFWRGQRQNIQALENRKDFTFILSDVSKDSDWASDMQETDTMIHIADIVAGIGYVFSNEFDVFAQNNKINTMVASVVSDKKPKKIIYLGTACSYPQSLQRNTTTSKLSERVKLPADPESGYGWSKLIGEIELRLAIKDIDTQLVVLDLHNVYGAPCIYKDKTSQVIPSLIWRALKLEKGDLSVWGNGSQGRAFVHVSEVVDAIKLALYYKGKKDCFMIGPDFCSTIREVANIIISHPKIRVNTISYDLDKPTGDIGRFADFSLAKSELGWSPKISLKKGLFDLIDYVLEQDKHLHNTSKK